MARQEMMKLGAFVPGALTGGHGWRAPGVDTAGQQRTGLLPR